MVEKFHKSTDIAANSIYAYTRDIKENGLCFVVFDKTDTTVEGLAVFADGNNKKQVIDMEIFLHMMDKDTLSFMEIVGKKIMKEFKKITVD